MIWGVLIISPKKAEANGEGPPFTEFLPANETFSFIYSFDLPYQPFSPNFVFNLSSNINTTLNMNFNTTSYPLPTSRQIGIQISHNETQSEAALNFTALFDLERFLNNLPENPNEKDLNLGLQYNTFYRIRTNISISEISFKFMKEIGLGFEDSDKNFSIGFHKGQIESNPELIQTNLIEESGIEYLEGEIKNFEKEKEYYISLYEIKEGPPISPTPYYWLWILIPITIAFIALIVVMSKKDYIKRLKKRTTSIDKGAHKLDIEEVLENENRSKIIDLILEKPGIHFNELLRETKLAPGNLVWHLDILETYKIIKKKHLENYVIYIPYYNRNPLSNIDLKLQKSDLTLKVLEMIEEDPGIWNSKITDKMEIHRKTIQYHIDKLIDLGLVYRKKEGSKKKIYPNLKAEYYEEKALRD